MTNSKIVWMLVTVFGLGLPLGLVLAQDLPEEESRELQRDFERWRYGESDDWLYGRVKAVEIQGVGGFVFTPQKGENQDGGGAAVRVRVPIRYGFGVQADLGAFGAGAPDCPSEESGEYRGPKEDIKCHKPYKGNLYAFPLSLIWKTPPTRIPAQLAVSAGIAFASLNRTAQQDWDNKHHFKWETTGDWTVVPTVGFYMRPVYRQVTQLIAPEIGWTRFINPNQTDTNAITIGVGGQF